MIFLRKFLTGFLEVNYVDIRIITKYSVNACINLSFYDSSLFKEALMSLADTVGVNVLSHLLIGISILILGISIIMLARNLRRTR